MKVSVDALGAYIWVICTLWLSAVYVFGLRSMLECRDSISGIVRCWTFIDIKFHIFLVSTGRSFAFIPPCSYAISKVKADRPACICRTLSHSELVLYWPISPFPQRRKHCSLISFYTETNSYIHVSQDLKMPNFKSQNIPWWYFLLFLHLDQLDTNSLNGVWKEYLILKRNALRVRSVWANLLNGCVHPCPWQTKHSLFPGAGTRRCWEVGICKPVHMEVPR